MNVKLLKIQNIVGMHYSTQQKTNTLVIYGIGAPNVPDSGNLPDAKIILSFGYDIFVPDYIGFGRSDGTLTPQNCIQTFLQLYENFTLGCYAKNTYENISFYFKYKRIIFIGRSFGGTYIPLLPRFNSKITELGLIYPVVDSKSCGSIPGEESNQQFLDSMLHDGYHHIYRGILQPVWKDHLENKDDLSPMDNIKHLNNTKLFIGHGKNDTCVHFSKSQKYYEKICSTFPSQIKNFKLSLYDGGHNATTSHLATKDFLNWLQ